MSGVSSGGPSRRARAALSLTVLAAAITGPVPPVTLSHAVLHADTQGGVNAHPELSIDDARMLEGDSGSQSLMFTLHLSVPSADTVTVNVATFDSTATAADFDYEPLSVLVTFAPGSIAESLGVHVLGDTKFEPDEVFGVRLSEPVNAVFRDSVAVGTIINDDAPLISVSDSSTAEGDTLTHPLPFRVRLAQPVGFPVTFTYHTVDGTATAADNDYIPVTGDTTFAPGQDQIVIEVPIVGDRKLEGNEAFSLQIQSAQGQTASGVGVILNDERATFTSQPLAGTSYDGITTPWGDCNGDGYPDLPLFFGGPGGTFSEMPGFRTLLAGGNYHGGSWCDYDRDGDLDLVIFGYYLGAWDDMTLASTQPPTPNLVLQNQGNGTFVNVAPALGMDVAGNSETTVWGDFDGDGWPDLFAPFYAQWYPYHSFLYHNNGDGTFTDIAKEAGVDLAGLPQNLRPEGAASVDWNGDGYLDLYCASHFFINDGTGHFIDVRQAVGLPQMFDEGANFVDYDNDGDFDLYIRGVDHPYLFRNDNGHFTDVTAQSGIGNAPLCWGDTWADVDNDGDLDLLQCNCNGPARLMLNQGDGTFVEDLDFETVSPPGAISSWADVDGDGDLDVVVGTNRLLVNHLDQMPGFSGSSLRVRVLDAEGHETAHGATVRLKQLGGGPGTTQTRVVDGGSGYLGQNEYTVQFGGVGSGAYALEVDYPSPRGTRVVVDSLVNPVLGHIEPARGMGRKLTVYRDGRVDGLTANAAVPPVKSSARVRWLGAPYPTPGHHLVSFLITVDSPAHVALAIHDLSGRLLRRLDEGLLPAGQHSVQWNLTDERGAPVPTGIYFCRLLLDGNPAETRRVIVAR